MSGFQFPQDSISQVKLKMGSVLGPVRSAGNVLKLSKKKNYVFIFFFGLPPVDLRAGSKSYNFC